MTDPLIKRLFLLDGMALIYRAHFAMVRSPRYTSASVCTSAVFGMTNAILDILKREEPSHIAAVFDTSAPTHRHIEYPAYKAQRDAMPEDLSSQIPLVFRLFEAFNIPVITIDGYEADDIIGTLAHEAEQQHFTTYMVTPDKDFQQLLTDNIYIYRPGRQGNTHEVVGVADVLEKWGLENVRQFIDILGLMGDASDNIPGIKGIGEKTAQKLIADFGSIENLLQSTGKLKGKQRERVEQGADDAILSKRLATILLDVPHTIDLDSLKAKDFDKERLSQLFMELEFETFGKRMFGKSFSVGATKAKVVREKREAEIQQQLFFDEPVEEKTIHNSPHTYHTITTANERSALVEKLLAQKRICFDTETTGLNPREVEPLGLSFSFADNEAYYVVFPTSPEETKTVLEQFRPVFENEAIEKVGHNLKYDITLLKWQGIEVRGALFDTMLAHSMKEPEMRHGLDYLAKLYLGYTPIPTSDLIGPKGPEQKNMRDVPLEQLAQYACEDADVTWRINDVIRADIENRGVSQVCYEVECPLIPVLVDMEFEGIRLDVDSLAVYSKHLEGEIADLTARIHSAAGREFNIDSPKQLGVVLYEDLQIDDKPKKTATGQYSTRESELLRLSGRHEIVQDILDYRSAVKLKNTYVDQLPAAVNPQTGRLHTHYSQTWTATGRMQSNDPNLQTIPIRKARGKEIRAAFVPRDDDYLILSADYSQIELRIMAELSQDAGMIEAFTSGEDIHTVTASKVYKVDLADVTREMRDKAKTVNFGILYGISAFGLQQRLNIPRGEASALIDNYFEKYPGVQTYIDATIAFAKEHGYVVTKTGRRRYLRDITSRNHSARTASERLAMNSPIQGTAADMLKLAMIKVHAALKAADMKTKMLLTVHDEIVFDLHKSEQESAVPLIEEAMRTAFPMSVPIVVETGVGKNWLEAH
ncbi:DNA polymerase I [Rosistilla carotiformis]|uniref:DNA polymerase I n=1 Tax=Rosistilla carotiformis TaxID=2528017 RepID=A0A518JT98_9BACT|nr:DNA polymerase I [Rosistilla carotiformis]QDV68764.1 DNA polymerase I [Rosistilla carotiformis]